MALAASVVINRAAKTLLDSGQNAWTAAEHLDYLNAVITALCGIKKDAYTVRGAVPLVAGIYQALPAGATQFVDVIANDGAGNGTVSVVSRKLLDDTLPAWPAATQTAAVEDVMVDDRDPKRFFVYPPNTGTGSLIMLYGAVPTRLTSAADVMALDDTYESALWAGVLSQCYAKNSKRQDLSKSAMYHSLFLAYINNNTAEQMRLLAKLATKEG